MIFYWLLSAYSRSISVHGDMFANEVAIVISRHYDEFRTSYFNSL